MMILFVKNTIIIPKGWMDTVEERLIIIICDYICSYPDLTCMRPIGHLILLGE